MLNGFSISYEIITPESAEEGEAAETGFHYDSLTLREAVQEIRNVGGGYCEADSYPIQSPRWFTIYQVREDYCTGEVESWGLHLPKSLTPATRRRIARLLGCYGA